MQPNIQEEKSSLQGGEESSLPYTTSASSYPSTNLSQEGLYDAMAHGTYEEFQESLVECLKCLNLIHTYYKLPFLF